MSPVLFVTETTLLLFGGIMITALLRARREDVPSVLRELANLVGQFAGALRALTQWLVPRR